MVFATHPVPILHLQLMHQAQPVLTVTLHAKLAVEQALIALLVLPLVHILTFITTSVLPRVQMEQLLLTEFAKAARLHVSLVLSQRLLAHLVILVITYTIVTV